MATIIRVLVVAVLGSACALSQITSTVGPSPAPPGSPILIAIANDTAAATWVGSPCPFRVHDLAGNNVFTPFCIAIVINVDPGEVFSTFWPQIYDTGGPVPPGTYMVDVFTPVGIQSHAVVVDAAVDANLATVGPIRPGTTRSVYLTAPVSAGADYGAAVSFLPVLGIPTCAGVVPLSDDPLLALALTPNPFFTGLFGTLDVSGGSLDPQIAIPDLPWLSGISFAMAFVTVDLGQPCFITAISEPNTIVIP